MEYKEILRMIMRAYYDLCDVKKIEVIYSTALECATQIYIEQMKLGGKNDGRTGT